jgi:hypothetical protein
MQFADPGERRRTVVIDGVSVAGARDAGLVHDVDAVHQALEWFATRGFEARRADGPPQTRKHTISTFIE